VLTAVLWPRWQDVRDRARAKSNES